MVMLHDHDPVPAIHDEIGSGRWRRLLIDTAVLLMIGGCLAALVLIVDREGLQLRLSRLEAWDLLMLSIPMLLGVTIGLPPSLVALACGMGLGMIAGTLAALLLNTAGGGLTFMLGYLVRGKPAPPRGRRRERLLQVVRSADWRLMAILRLVPILPYPIMNYLLGRTGLQPRHFMIGTLVGIIPGMLAYAWIGTLSQRWLIYGQDPAGVEWLLAICTALLLPLIGFLLRHHIRELINDSLVDEDNAQGPPAPSPASAE